MKKIKKILIPNRGEISVRIQRTCRELQIPTVAVYSDPDRSALHVRYADEAYALGGSSPVETYLNLDKIFDIAKRSGADAIHPGYGFLSEYAAFVRECDRRGILFIGPTADSMELMGFKTRSRELMSRAGVPVVPGSEPIGDEAILKLEAKRIGYPLMIKASAGGGGKGMRLVENCKELLPAFDTCRREAGAAFGDATVYIEKYLENPRHIEFQILADSEGHTVHIFERECSIQRRHQKIIEESPSPVLSESLRGRMGEAALAAARACGYVNAGTVEFLVDRQLNFYFLEMNTRLQVEHPITELVTGIDLVQKQIRIAEGISIKSLKPQKRGAAMECRIYAEDPGNNFLPSPGKIEAITTPEGPGTRNDTGVYTGFTIPLEYDPMISKLAVWGQDREEARQRMLRALEEYHLLGVKTNIRYLSSILKHTRFISGKYDTHFIQIFGEELKEKEDPGHETIALAAAAVLQYRRDSQSAEPAPGAGSEQSKWKTSARIKGLR